MKRHDHNKTKQLGEPHGTASNKLRKLLLYSLAQQLGLSMCFRCNLPIEHIDQFSIDHKIPWQDSDDPKGLFFSLENIAFSHSSCNSKAGRRLKKYATLAEKANAKRVSWRNSQRRSYTIEKRRAKYLKYGY